VALPAEFAFNRSRDFGVDLLELGGKEGIGP